MEGPDVTSKETLRLEPFDVVLLQPGEPHPCALDGTPVDLSQAELTDAQQQALLDSAVQIFPADLTDRAQDEVDALQTPACFKHSGWLQDHHALILDEAARSGPVRFELHATYGLCIEEDE